MKRTGLFLVLVSLSGAAVAAPAPKVAWRPVAWAPVTAAAPVIDGDLADPAWRDATVLGPFSTPDGEAVKNQGAGKVTWDARNLYLAVEMQQPVVEQPGPESCHRDGDIYMGDCVEVFIDAALDGRTYYHLLVNPANAQRDEKGDTAGNPSYNVAWNAEWQSAAAKTPRGWNVEMAIPLSVLRLDAGREPVIGLNLCRNDKAGGSISCWAATGGGFHVPTRFGLVALARSARAPRLNVTVTEVGRLEPGASAAKGSIRNPGTTAVPAAMEVAACGPKSVWRHTESLGILEPEGRLSGAIAYRIAKAGSHTVVFATRDNATGALLHVGGFAFDVPILFSQRFGHRLPSVPGLDLWWAESAYKVMKSTPLPQPKTAEVRLSAARREWEPFQLVLRSPKGLKGVTAKVGDFRQGRSRIPASAFQVLKVERVPVVSPTDAFGTVDDYPDPLPPLRGAFDVPAGENTPLWVLAHVPADAPAGDYLGRVTLSAAGSKPVAVPVRLHVFDFALTEETHTRTAYGLGLPAGFQGLKEPADQEAVWEKYLACFRDHRLSPYAPMARHPIREEVHDPSWRFTNGPLELVCDQYSNNYFRVIWKGKPLAALTSTMTQFEREGVGWQGKGVNWPGISSLKEVRVLERSAKRWVLEVTGENAGSAPASRRYQITFRLYVPAGQPWFAVRMMGLKNTDETRFRMQGYFYVTRPAFESRQVVKGPGYALWQGDGRAVGALSFPADRAFEPAPIYVQKDAWLDPGQSVEGFGPTMLFLAGDAATPDEARALVERVRATLGTTDPADWVPADGATLAVEEKAEATITHDFSDFDKAAAKYLDQWKFNGFSFGRVPDSIGGHRRGTPEYDRLHKLSQGAQVRHLKEKGWLDKAYCYWKDEPEEREYDWVNEGMDILGRTCPGLTRLLTEEVQPKLVGHVDLWVPVLSNYDVKRCHERQRAGDHVWWYVCCGPRAPYPNDFIDHPGICHRIRYWMMEKYGVEGDLYWATTYYSGKEGALRNPWESAMSISPDGGKWGNGDGMLLYPPCRQPSKEPVREGPVVSQRIELIREGLEDLEYFWTLKQAMKSLQSRMAGLPAGRQAEAKRALVAARKALNAPNRLAASLTEYTKDPEDLIHERQALAEAIEALGRVR